MTAPEATALDAIEAAWGESVPCDWEHNARACKRTARWAVNTHGCDFFTLCSHHFNLWVRECEAIAATCPGPYCPDCDKPIAAVMGDYITAAVRL